MIMGEKKITKVFLLEGRIKLKCVFFMGLLDQFKMASDMMKNMSPEQISDLMKQAEQSKTMLEDAVRKVLGEETKKRGLVTRVEVGEMFRNH